MAVVLELMCFSGDCLSERGINLREKKKEEAAVGSCERYALEQGVIAVVAAAVGVLLGACSVFRSAVTHWDWTSTARGEVLS